MPREPTQLQILDRMCLASKLHQALLCLFVAIHVVPIYSPQSRRSINELSMMRECTHPSAACRPLIGSAGPLISTRGTSAICSAPTQRSLCSSRCGIYLISLHAHQALKHSLSVFDRSCVKPREQKGLIHSPSEQLHFKDPLQYDCPTRALLQDIPYACKDVMRQVSRSHARQRGARQAA